MHDLHDLSISKFLKNIVSAKKLSMEVFECLQSFFFFWSKIACVHTVSVLGMLNMSEIKDGAY